MNARAVVGTSGFAYADWKPRFYPAEVAQAKFLPHYATRLSGVEINYTFSRFPTEQLLSGWAAKVPDSFVFCLKTPQMITHRKRLRDCAEPFADFLRIAQTLAGRLGPVLVQLPPSMKADAGLLRDFLAAPRPAVRLAFEFRDPSWDDEAVDATLAEAGAARVAAETGEVTPSPDRVPAPFAYLRLRRDAYDDAAVDAWIARIAGMLDRGLHVHCFLRHDADGSNALAAERMIAALGEGARE